MFTFALLFKIDIILLLSFVALILLVYITRLIAFWLESFDKELYWIKTANWVVCDVAANLSILMPFFIVIANIVFLILILI